MRALEGGPQVKKAPMTAVIQKLLSEDGMSHVAHLVTCKNYGQKQSFSACYLHPSIK